MISIYYEGAWVQRNFSRCIFRVDPSSNFGEAWMSSPDRKRRAPPGDDWGRRAEDIKAPRLYDDTVIIDLVVETYPETAKPLRETCVGLRSHPSLLASVVNRGALEGMIKRSTYAQASELVAALEIVGNRLQADPWAVAVRLAVERRKEPAVVALLQAYPTYELAGLTPRAWSAAISSSRAGILRLLLEDARVDPVAGMALSRAADACSSEALAALLEDDRIIAAFPDVESALGTIFTQAQMGCRDALACLRVFATQVNAVFDSQQTEEALAYAARRGDSATLKPILLLDRLRRDSVAAAVVAAASRLGPEWDRKVVTSGDSTCPALGTEAYDGAVLRALLAHPLCSAEAAAAALAPAAAISNRDATLLLLQRAGGPSAVPGAVAARVLGVVARIRPLPLLGDLPAAPHHRLVVPSQLQELRRRWLPASPPLSRSQELENWVADEPLVSALLAVPHFDHVSVGGGGPSLLARAVLSNRLGVVRCLIRDGRFSSDPPEGEHLRVLRLASSISAEPVPFEECLPVHREDASPVDVELEYDALTLAAAAGHETIVAALLASPRGTLRPSAVVSAARAGHAAIVRMLCAAMLSCGIGPPPPAAVCAAAQSGSVDTLAALVSAGGDAVAPCLAFRSLPRWYRFAGQNRPAILVTPLQAAALACQPSTVQYLLSATPAVAEADARAGSTSVVAAARALKVDVDDPFDDSDTAYAEGRAWESFRSLLADNRLDATCAIKVYPHASFTSAVLAEVMAAASFNPASPIVSRAVARAAGSRDVQFFRVLLEDMRIDPSADDNAALIAAVASLSTPCQEAEEALVCEIVDVLLRDPRVCAGARDSAALVTAAQAGALRVIRQLLVPSAGGFADPSAQGSAALVAAAGGLHADVVDALCNDTRTVPSDAALRAASAAYCMHGIASAGGSVNPAVGRIVCRLLADQRVSPAAGHIDLVRRWAICGGVAALLRVANAYPEALSSVHPCLIERGAYCESDDVNEIAIDFLLGRGITTYDAGSLFPSSLDSADVASVLFRAIERGNLPPGAISSILSLPPTQLGEVFSFSLEALVTTRHCDSYSTCAALPLAERQAHLTSSLSTPCVSSQLDSAVTLCELDVCANLACRRSMGSLQGSCNDDVKGPPRCLKQHCLGLCCSDDAMLARVNAALAHPSVDPSARESSVLLAAARNEFASASVIRALLHDGRADPSAQPHFLPALCERWIPSPEAVAVALADARVCISSEALAAAVTIRDVDIVDLVLRSLESRIASCVVERRDMPPTTAPVHAGDAIIAAASAGFDSRLRRLLHCCHFLSQESNSDERGCLGEMLERPKIAVVQVTPSDLMAALCAAAKCNNAVCIRTIVPIACRVFKSAFDTSTAIRAAVENGHADAITALLQTDCVACDRPPCPQHCSVEVSTAALGMAVENGHPEAVRALLSDSRIALGRVTSSGNTAATHPLVVAARAGFTEIVRALLEDPRCAGAASIISVAACMAANAGHAGTLRALLASQATTPEVRCAALSAAILASQAHAIAAVLTTGSPLDASALANAALEVCQVAATAPCLDMICATDRNGAAAAALAADDCAALRHLCAKPSVSAELVALVIVLCCRSGGDPAARDCEALRAAAGADNASAVATLLHDRRVAMGAAGGSVARAFVAASQRESGRGVVWVLAPVVSDFGSLREAAAALARRGDGECLRRVLARMSPRTPIAVAELTQLRMCGAGMTVDGTAAASNSGQVNDAIDEWLGKQEPL